ncbi:MAG: ATP-binding cassette domain-containing protein [Actinobacteria bacterium]|nr:ATP-binding cassette domain-containing protein [Actinomycetota bacterium]
MGELQVSAAVPARGLEVSFTVAAGEVLAVLGPNGAGKSTTAAVLAGLLRPERAVIRIGGRTLTDTGRGVAVPIHDRRVGLMLQDPLLFPHMSVLGNVTFAARRHDDARTRARHWLQRVDAAELAGRKPGMLSGGQAQRVALARALAAEPDALVLDEPLAGLDVAGASSMRAMLREVLLQDSRPVVLITHDLLDVLGLADRALVLESGHVAEVGPVADVLAAPRSHFGARFAGVNLVRGIVAGPGTLRTVAESEPGQTWYGVAVEPLTVGCDAVAVFAPGAVAVYRDRPHGSPRNSIRVRIAGLDVDAGAVTVRADDQADGGPGLAAAVTAESLAQLGLAVGERVWFTIKTQEVGLHAAGRPGA